MNLPPVVLRHLREDRASFAQRFDGTAGLGYTMIHLTVSAETLISSRQLNSNAVAPEKSIIHNCYDK
jgi:hypothetical protein